MMTPEDVAGKHVCYVLRCGAGAHIKIGYTQNLPQRMNALTHQSGRDLTLYGVFVHDSEFGARSREKYLHALFSDARGRGEWFAAKCIQDIKKIKGFERVGAKSRENQESPAAVSYREKGPVSRLVSDIGAALSYYDLLLSDQDETVSKEERELIKTKLSFIGDFLSTHKQQLTCRSIC